MTQKVKKHRFLKYFWLLGPFIKARIRIRSQTSGSGSDQKGPDPTEFGSGSTTLLTTPSLGCGSVADNLIPLPPLPHIFIHSLTYILNFGIRPNSIVSPLWEKTAADPFVAFLNFYSSCYYEKSHLLTLLALVPPFIFLLATPLTVSVV
jgi:hypothetical protein